jgi:hypothetical protein
LKSSIDAPVHLTVLHQPSQAGVHAHAHDGAHFASDWIGEYLYALCSSV